MRRGTDESAIESMAEAAEPIVYDLKKHRQAINNLAQVNLIG